jgi:hypothetical protein
VTEGRKLFKKQGKIMKMIYKSDNILKRAIYSRRTGTNSGNKG